MTADHQRVDARARVLLALAIMSDPGLSRQLIDERPAQAGYRLCRFWFEHVYVPGLWTMDGLKNRSAEDVKAFEECFDDSELAYLERFNRFIELRLEMSRKQFLASDSIDVDRWSGVVRDAGNTLALIEPDYSLSSGKLREAKRLLTTD